MLSIQSRGFTLIELLVVIAVIGLLSSIVLTSVSAAKERAIDAARLTTVKDFKDATLRYFSDTGSMPAALPDRGDGWAQSHSSPTNFMQGLVTAKYLNQLPVDEENTGSYRSMYYRVGDYSGFCASVPNTKAIIHFYIHSVAKQPMVACSAQNIDGGLYGQCLCII